jgi:hypothetical protein
MKARMEKTIPLNTPDQEPSSEFAGLKTCRVFSPPAAKIMYNPRARNATISKIPSAMPALVESLMPQ